MTLRRTTSCAHKRLEWAVDISIHSWFLLKSTDFTRVKLYYLPRLKEINLVELTCSNWDVPLKPLLHLIPKDIGCRTLKIRCLAEWVDFSHLKTSHPSKELSHLNWEKNWRRSVNWLRFISRGKTNLNCSDHRQVILPDQPRKKHLIFQKRLKTEESHRKAVDSQQASSANAN